MTRQRGKGGRNTATQFVRGFSLVLCTVLGLSAGPAKEWHVGSINLTGNRAFPTKNILSVMETRPMRIWRASPYSPSKLKFDLQSIHALYLENGYLDAQVSISNVVLDTATYRAAITIAIIERSPTLIDSVVFQGESVLSERILRRRVHSSIGKPLSFRGIKRDAAVVTLLLASRGRLQALVIDSVQIDSVRKKAEVLFIINQGPTCISGPVRITGLKGVHPRVVERELCFAAGDTLTSLKIQNSIKRLYGSNLFNFVQVVPVMSDTTNRAGSQQIPVTVTVDQSKYFTLDASAGYGTYDQFRGALRTAYADCFGLGQVLALGGIATRFSQRAELSYSVPWIFSTPLLAEAATYVERHDITYKGLFEGVRLSLVPQHPERLSYRLWGQYEKTLYIHIDTTKDTVIASKNTQSIGIDFSYDARAGGSVRKKGILIRCAPELAGLGGSGSNQFYRGLVDLRGYFDLSQTVKLSTALCAGYAHGYGSAGGLVPPQARYYIGSEGLRPVRGYTTDTVGGMIVLVINLFELNIPVYKWIGFTIFSDGGYAGETYSPTTLKAIRWVAGPGLSVKTPLGELRADFAYRLTGKHGWGAPFISIGSAF